MELNPDSVLGHALRGQWYLFKHQSNGSPEFLDKALGDLEMAAKLGPKNWEVRMWRGIAYGKKGETKKAFADFEAAIRSRPNEPRIYEHRAALYRMLDNDKAAEQDERKARELRKAI